MNNNNRHIDNIFRDKFDDFSPMPPSHIWTGIESGINSKPNIPLYKNKRIITASAIFLLAILAAFVVINPISFSTSEKNLTQKSTIDKNNHSISDIKESNSNILDNDEVLNDNNNVGGSNKSNNLIAEIPEAIIKNKPPMVDNIEATINHDAIVTIGLGKNIETTNDLHLDVIKMKQSFQISTEPYNYNFTPENRNYQQSFNAIAVDKPKNISSSHWKVGSYISPELSISNIDSVEILNAYTISIEPTYFINNNWFFRFGVGFSYVRDRGFAKINYITNDYIGSYDDVYDITFDTIAGQISPVYHTKSVEIWDSVHHVSVSNVTNKYVYLQLPALFGFYSKKPNSHIGWYIMGGPVFNIKTSSWIDNPTLSVKDADIIRLQNNLPIRANKYFQLWVGAGVEYQVNKKLSVAVEPGYRHYFKSIYNESYSATSSSGFALRVGLVYLIN